ncbi:MAG: N-formylglutamate amidohydrolase [Rubellimicrobium sp.]|nr:N-formylglutamate amidohydrolase [Rubellimicrobium sp.]
MRKEPYRLHMPARRTTSVVFASPHSGCDYPDAFLQAAVIDARLLRSSEDAFVDRLFAAAPACGAPLLAAVMPRAFVDLNRATDELDPDLIEGVGRSAHNPRVASGLGVIPRVVSGGRLIRHGRITRAEAEARIAGWWQPYHARMQGLLDEAHRDFGEAILIDCHSMPHEVIAGTMPSGAAMAGAAQAGGPVPVARRPDVVLGDRFGASADPGIVERLSAAFRRAGLVTARNTPFAGAYVTRHYGRPSRRQHAIQIEIDRALYMDEQRIEPRADFEAFRALLTGIIAEIAEIGRPEAPPVAAE